MNILIVDDQPLICQGLAALLVGTQAHVQVQVAHTAAYAQKILQHATAPDWLFLDINLPDDPHYQLFHALCSTPLIERTVLISANPGHRLIHTALALGARGFIPKDAAPDRVLRGLAAIFSGEFYMPPEVAAQRRQTSSENTALPNLSPRLQQVQSQLLSGASNKRIALNLNLSTHTVKEYVSSVLAFHAVTSRLELVLKIASE